MPQRRQFLRKKEQQKLSPKTVRILELLAQGLTADDVMHAEPEITANDIARAAEQAMMVDFVAQAYRELRERIQAEYPRAYEPWTQLDDQRIVELYRERRTMRQIAATVQRHHDAVRSRLQTLGQ